VSEIVLAKVVERVNPSALPKEVSAEVAAMVVVVAGVAAPETGAAVLLV
jgi:hypothetical protein